MGLKKRTFTGTVRSGVLSALQPGVRLSKKGLMSQLRSDNTPNVSLRTLRVALTKLLKERRIRLEGARAGATFVRASRTTAKPAVAPPN